jgi:photosynthetic reaction center H subunit
MHPGAITSHIDVAQVTLYAFWIFFAGLILYLRGEDRREGFPLQSDTPPYKRLGHFLGIPKPKTFLLANGETRTAPREEVSVPVSTAVPIGGWPGAPLHPIGDPMLAAVGPGSYANRPDVPDHMFDTGAPKIVPLRTDHEFSLTTEDPDPRGMRVVAADRKIAGTVADVWVDRAEVVIRYLEIEIPTSEGARRVLAPMPAASIDGRRGRVTIDAILSSQFANVPATKSPDQVTLLEEDKIAAYYAAGRLYATPARQEPLI